ncbi:MAG: LytTR family DNA-binding domain-containing protein [Salinivirgaceae bacterium]|jgi:two-component system LytT family response regulator|nr:LytTR family DNA-binding domain-containing protein [Salinivirgaceae bacterium]
MLKAVIVDDEIASIDSLEILLSASDVEIEVVGRASNIQEARKSIEKSNPHLVFLDIEMPNGSGFDLLDTFTDVNFKVIFITAYNQYAIKAFKYAAVDYILKPIDINTLQGALRRVNRSLDGHSSAQLDVLSEAIRNSSSRRIALSTSEAIEVVDTNSIIQFVAEGNYTVVHIEDQKPVIVSKSIKEFDEIMTSTFFFRCHKSHLINFQQIQRVVRNQNQIIMRDDSVAYISRRKRSEFFEAIDVFLNMF